jgi:hypothetical protein
LKTRINGAIFIKFGRAPATQTIFIVDSSTTPLRNRRFFNALPTPRQEGKLTIQKLKNQTPDSVVASTAPTVEKGRRIIESLRRGVKRNETKTRSKPNAILANRRRFW